MPPSWLIAPEAFVSDERSVPRRRATNFQALAFVVYGMDELNEALESLMAVRGIEQIARGIAKSPDQSEVALLYAKDVIDAIERFVTYLTITSRTSVTLN